MDDPRPFRILGMQQVAIGGLDADAMRHFWVDLLGIPKVGEFQSPSQNVEEDILSLGLGPHAVEIDLMRPLDPDGRPRIHAPNLHHFGLWVDDLRVAVQWLEDSGVRLVGGGIQPGAAGHDVCFVHPKGSPGFPIGATGVLLELVQAPPEILALHDD
ncbi:MAG: VOC family protein [Planctomycetota bacterium]|jgi:lactoylglutathione lyase